MNIQIVILVGGLGKRLRPLTLNIPKAMVKVNGKPFLHYQLELLKKNGIKDILICAGYRNKKIRDFFGNGERFGVNLKYSIETARLLGTAGALKKAQGLLNRNFMIIYGDSYLPIDFKKVYRAYLRSKSPALMTVFKNRNKLDKSNAMIEDGRVICYNKTSNGRMKYIDYGLSVLTRNVIEALPKNKVVQLETVFGRLAEQGRLAAFEVKKTFYEIGSRKGLERFKEYQKSNIKN